MKKLCKILTVSVILSILFTFFVPVFAKTGSLGSVSASDSSLKSVDFNGDSVIDILDLIFMKKSISNSTFVGSNKVDGIKYNTDNNYVAQDITSLIDVILGKANSFEKYDNSEILDDF